MKFADSHNQPVNARLASGADLATAVSPSLLQRLRKYRPVLAAVLVFACGLPRLDAQAPGSAAPAAPARPAARRPVAEVVREPVAIVSSKRFHFRKADKPLTVPCESTVNLTGSNPSVRHLIIMVHGLFRQNEYQKTILDALELGDSPKGVAVISPQFLIGMDITAHKLGDDYPYWSVNGWRVGQLSNNDADLPRLVRVSSFEVVDHILSWAMEALPNLKSVAVCGFSAGGQFLSRYAALNGVHQSLVDRGIDVRYVIGSPSAYLYVDSSRATSLNPISFGPIEKTADPDCKDYNRYPYGLEEPSNSYVQKAGGTEKIREQFGQRHLILLVGEKDDESSTYGLLTGCSADLQGGHRLERAKIYFEYLKYLYGPDVQKHDRLVTVPGAGHSSRELFISPQGVDALLGNFSPSGKKN